MTTPILGLSPQRGAGIVESPVQAAQVRTRKRPRRGGRLRANKGCLPDAMMPVWFLAGSPTPARARRAPTAAG